MRSRFFSDWPDGRIGELLESNFSYLIALTADKYSPLGIGHLAALQVVELNGSVGVGLSRNSLDSGQRALGTDIEIQSVAL